MLNLGNLQAHIINDLISHDLKDRAHHVGEDFIQIEYRTDIRDISGLIGHFHCYPKMYFKNKKSTTEFLALGAWKKFKSLYEYEEINNINKANEFLVIPGAQRFQQEEKTVEWHGLEDCYFFLPQILISQEDTLVTLKLNLPKDILSSSTRKREYLHEIATTLDPHTITYKDHNNYQIGSTTIPQKNEWNDIVNKSLKAIQDSNLSKVVLSRKLIAKYKKQVCAEDIFNNSKESAHDSYIVYFQLCQNQTFISYSPETLFKVKNGDLQLDALAGTRARGKSEQEDNYLRKDLLTDKKELEEHRCVTDYISNKMQPLVEELNILDKEQIMSLRYVQHIHTNLEGKLKQGVSIFNLLHTFHPTPAVGGMPKENALSSIKELEPFSRGLYASPIGYVSNTNAEFCVAIRSALVNNNNVHIYGGCGLVAGSIPQLEWVETQNKMKNFKSVIEGAK